MNGLTPGPDLRNRNLCPSLLHLLAIASQNQGNFLTTQFKGKYNKLEERDYNANSVTSNKSYILTLSLYDFP